MAKEKEGTVIDVTGMSPEFLAILQAAMVKDGGRALVNSVASVEKNAASTRVADRAYRDTAKFMKEKFPTDYAKAYEEFKTAATILEKAGKLKKAKA